MDVRIVAMAMCEHFGYRDGNLFKSRGGVSSPLYLWNCRFSVIHFNVNNVEELYGAVNRVGAPSMVANMPGAIIHKRGPLFRAPWIPGYAILKKVTLNTP